MGIFEWYSSRKSDCQEKSGLFKDDRHTMKKTMVFQKGTKEVIQFHS